MIQKNIDYCYIVSQIVLMYIMAKGIRIFLGNWKIFIKYLLIRKRRLYWRKIWRGLLVGMLANWWEMGWRGIRWLRRMLVSIVSHMRDISVLNFWFRLLISKLWKLSILPSTTQLNQLQSSTNLKPKPNPDLRHQSVLPILKRTQKKQTF